MKSSHVLLVNLSAEELLRAVQGKLSENLNLTLSIRTLSESGIQVGVVGPADVTHGAKIEVIADPRLFRIRFTFPKNTENIFKKYALIKSRCHKFFVSEREIERGNFEYLALDLTGEVADILKEIFKIDLVPTKA